MLHKIICEPNYNLPQQIDIDSIRNEAKQQAASKQTVVVEALDYDSDHDSKKPKAFNVLPLYSPPNTLLKKQLSLQHNEYLACKFDKYLTDKPKQGIQVRLYHEIISQQKKPKPRRMKLNGKFYDVDHKLAPTPYIPDPRQYCKQSNCKNANQAKRQY